MRNLKRALSLLLSLAVISAALPLAAAAPHSKEGYAYKDADEIDIFIEIYESNYFGIKEVQNKLQFVIDLGIMGTYAEGGKPTNFDPGKQLTRLEYTHMYALLHNGGQISDTRLGAYASMPSPFSDFGNTHPQYPWVMYAYYHGLVSGYGDGTFRPDNPMSVNAALVTALKLQGAENAATAGWNGGGDGFIDTATSAVTKFGWGGDEYIWAFFDNCTKSGRGITRGEAAILFASLMEKPLYRLGIGSYVQDGEKTFGKVNFGCGQITFRVVASPWFALDVGGATKDGYIRIRVDGDSEAPDYIMPVPYGWDYLATLRSVGGRFTAAASVDTDGDYASWLGELTALNPLQFGTAQAANGAVTLGGKVVDTNCLVYVNYQSKGETALTAGEEYCYYIEDGKLLYAFESAYNIGIVIKDKDGKLRLSPLKADDTADAAVATRPMEDNTFITGGELARNEDDVFMYIVVGDKESALKNDARHTLLLRECAAVGGVVSAARAASCDIGEHKALAYSAFTFGSNQEGQKAVAALLEQNVLGRVYNNTLYTIYVPGDSKPGMVTYSFGILTGFNLVPSTILSSPTDDRVVILGADGKATVYHTARVNGTAVTEQTKSTLQAVLLENDGESCGRLVAYTVDSESGYASVWLLGDAGAEGALSNIKSSASSFDGITEPLEGYGGNASTPHTLLPKESNYSFGVVDEHTLTFVDTGTAGEPAWKVFTGRLENAIIGDYHATYVEVNYQAYFGGQIGDSKTLLAVMVAPIPYTGLANLREEPAPPYTGVVVRAGEPVRAGNGWGVSFDAVSVAGIVRTFTLTGLASSDEAVDESANYRPGAAITLSSVGRDGKFAYDGSGFSDVEQKIKTDDSVNTSDYTISSGWHAGYVIANTAGILGFKSADGATGGVVTVSRDAVVVLIGESGVSRGVTANIPVTASGDRSNDKYKVLAVSSGTEITAFFVNTDGYWDISA
jgi:hypothetical protein